MKGPVEAKVAASSVAALVVPAVFAAAAWYHWFTPPPAALQAAIIAVVTGIAGWLAPHTHLRPEPKPSQQALFDMAEALGAEVRVPLAQGTRLLTAGPKLPKADPAPVGRGGYSGSKPASEMPPPPTDVPSLSVKPPEGTIAGSTP